MLFQVRRGEHFLGGILQGGAQDCSLVLGSPSSSSLGEALYPKALMCRMEWMVVHRCAQYMLGSIFQIT